MASSKIAIIVLLILGIAVSSYILAVDNILWQYNPRNYHAYALIAFVIIDALLIGVVLARPNAGSMAALVWGIIQVLALIGDAATGLQVPEVGPVAAAAYLFLGGAEGLNNPSGFAVDALLIIYVVLAAMGAKARRPPAKA